MSLVGHRAEVVGEEYPPLNTTAIHLYAGAALTANVSVHGTACGWA